MAQRTSRYIKQDGKLPSETSFPLWAQGFSQKIEMSLDTAQKCWSSWNLYSELQIFQKYISVS